MKKLFSKLFKPEPEVVLQEWEPWEVKAARFNRMHERIRGEVVSNVIDARTD